MITATSNRSPLPRQLLSALFLTIPLALAGCGEDESDQGAASAESGSEGPQARERVTDETVLNQGEELYEQNCAACHGAKGEGDENWRERNEDGTRPPPPLNGTGHTWHHPYWQLKDFIRYGGEPHGGVMPAFGDELSEEEIEAIIAWFQSLWDDEVYQAWLRYDRNYPDVETWEAEMGEEWPVPDE